MIYLKKPDSFKPAYEAVGCFLEFNNEIILLLRQDHKPQENTWGLPSGKINPGENPKSAMIREIKEETGIIVPAGKLKFFMTIYVKNKGNNFIYHIYNAYLPKKKEIKINTKEHKLGQWINCNEALNLPLIKELDNCIKLFYKI